MLLNKIWWRILEVLPFPEARRPTYRLKIDLGSSLGIKKSCAQLPANYRLAELPGKLIAAVVNLPPRQIWPELSEVLILGFPDENGNAILIIPEREVTIGARLF